MVRRVPTLSSKLSRSLFVAELVIGFGPVTVLLAIGAFVALSQILFMFLSSEARQDPGGSVAVVALACGGILGMVAVGNLVRSILYPGEATLEKRSTLTFGTVGFAALIYLIIDSDTALWRVFFVAPLVVSIHVLYLGRELLFARQGPGTPNDR